MQCSLSKIKKFKRDSLKIVIGGHFKTDTEGQECMLRLKYIVHLLETSDIQDFMVILKVEQSKRFPVICVEDLKNHIGTNATVFGEGYKNQYGQEGYKFVITNPNCKICGYGESWIM